MDWLTGLRSVSVLTLPIHFHSLWCSTDFVLHGWLKGAFLKDLAAKYRSLFLIELKGS
jgi:hypothetical protein